MRSAISFSFGLWALVLAFAACNHQEENHKPDVVPTGNTTLGDSLREQNGMEVSASAPDEDSTPKAFGFVAAPSGLRLRETVDRESKVLMNLPYNTRLLQTGGGQGPAFRVDGLEGKLCPVRVGDSAGYLFSGYLVPVPLPPLEAENRLHHLEQYLAKIEGLGFPALKKETDNPDGTHTTSFSLPVQTFEQCWLVLKPLLFIPQAYHLPKGDKATYSTPQNPSEAARESPYDYVEQYFFKHREPDSRISSHEYINENEVGGQYIKFFPEGEGFRVEVLEGTH